MDDLDSSSCFISAGQVGAGALERIDTGMARRFPRESVPAFDKLSQEDLIIYAFLNAEAKFKHPFEDYYDNLTFEDSTGKESEVAAFGVWDDSPSYDKLRDQVAVLYHSRLQEPNFASLDPNIDDTASNILARFAISEFAIDLCKYTQPYQIILARIDPQPTLALTLADLDEKLSEFTEYSGYESLCELSESYELYVPEMFWRIDHRFAELERTQITNVGLKGYPIKRAEQIIHFRLDRSGAVLKSHSTLLIELGATIGRRFSFDRPFLICMKKRDCEQPFFVMWVGNAELLNKK